MLGVDVEMYKACTHDVLFNSCDVLKIDSSKIDSLEPDLFRRYQQVCYTKTSFGVVASLRLTQPDYVEYG